jgi:GNAT superfamily N-acetyltransferase
MRECPLISTPRVVQVSGMFDVAIGERSRVEIKGELPIENLSWNVGLIVGPSGSGKTTVARELFAGAVVSEFEWPADRSILDGFPANVGIKTVTRYLNAVGFGSVPNWLRPFNVLSNGEKFRATVARAMAESADLIVLDEFTSVVDRQTAKIASHSVQKTIRRAKRQLIAVTCHYDILEWLQPDWVYEPHLAAFEARSLQQRPEISVEIRSVDKSIWSVFSKYHYLTSRLSPAAICVGAFIDDHCVGFSSAVKFVHPHVRNICQEHRTVVLPDYQGLSIGARLADWFGEYLWRRGWRFHAAIAHPGLAAYRSASPRWRVLRSGTLSGGARTASMRRHQEKFSARRISTSFAFTPALGTPSARQPCPYAELRNMSSAINASSSSNSMSG